MITVYVSHLFQITFLFSCGVCIYVLQAPPLFGLVEPLLDVFSIHLNADYHVYRLYCLGSWHTGILFCLVFSVVIIPCKLCVEGELILFIWIGHL